MKILLTVPPDREALTLEKEKDIAHGMGIYPPLGILYVATYLKKNSEHEVHILDPDSEKLRLKDIKERIKEINPDVFGITAFTNTLKTVVDELKIVKENLPNCITVMGGPHLSLYPKEAIKIKEVDFAINGDGEKAFFDLITILNKKLSDKERENELKKVEGIVFQSSDGQVYQNGYARVMDLNSMPFPDITLIKKELYFCILGKKKLMTTIATARGCPFKCTFCNSPDKIYRFRSAQNIVDEIEYVLSHGVTEIFFFDDLFNLNKNRVMEVCDEIIKRKLNKKITWSFRGRVNSLKHEEVVKRLKEAGCERIQLGIEKATDGSLKKLKKGITIKEIIQATDLIYKYGILCVGNFILFTPGEGEEEAEDIIKFSLKLKLHHAEFHIFAPYPGSEIYQNGLETKFFEKDYWAEYAENPYDGFSLLWEEKVPRDRMFEIANNAYKRFYFRPRIIWNELRGLSSWSEFIRKFKGGLTVLKLKS